MEKRDYPSIEWKPTPEVKSDLVHTTTVFRQNKALLKALHEASDSSAKHPVSLDQRLKNAEQAHGIFKITRGGF